MRIGNNLHVRLRLVATAVVSVLALAASGCGSAQRDLIARALDQPINDANLSVGMAVTQAGGDLVTFTAQGPYHSNGPNQLPSFDFKIDAGLHVLGSTRGATFDAISTGDDVFVRYGGQTYEVGKERIAAFTRRAARQNAKIGNPRTLGDFERLGLNLDSWFPDSEIVGEQNVDGVRATHLHGRIDIGAVFDDLKTFMSRYAPRGGPQPGANLTPAMVHQIEKAMTDPTFDVFVDKATGGFRRIAARMGIAVPGGPKLGMRMQFDWTEVGRRHEITAPASGQPISALGDRLAKKFGLNFAQLSAAG